MQIRFVLSLTFTLMLGLGSFLEASITSAQTNPPYLLLPDIGFEATGAEQLPVGVHFDVESGPTGGPYRTTQFFEGIASTEGNGAWAQRNNVWGICFNLVNCSG